MIIENVFKNVHINLNILDFPQRKSRIKLKISKNLNISKLFILEKQSIFILFLVETYFHVVKIYSRKVFFYLQVPIIIFYSTFSNLMV